MMDEQKIKAALAPILEQRLAVFDRDSERRIAEVAPALLAMRTDPIRAAKALDELLNRAYMRGFTDGVRGMSSALSASLPTKAA